MSDGANGFEAYGPLGCIGHNDPKLRTQREMAEAQRRADTAMMRAASGFWNTDPSVLQAMQRQINELHIYYDGLLQRCERLADRLDRFEQKHDERETNP
jgi:hypothetical protein